jgi:hypothetical protein
MSNPNSTKSDAASAVKPPGVNGGMEPQPRLRVIKPTKPMEDVMGRYLLLWLIGVPIPILILIWAFGGLS